MIASGYNHPDYAKSFIEFGIPFELPKSKGWILKRQIPGSSAYDAMWCYPLFVCRDWSNLSADLENLRDEFVTLSMVVDPFGEYDLSNLHQCFKDVVIPYKQHFVIDLSKPINSFISRHHRRYARQSIRNLELERCKDPKQVIEDWISLYATLVRRHKIEGISKFSRTAFTKQLEVPGMEVFRAMYDGTTIGMLLWYVQGEIGYYHLAAFSSLGYELHASFALFWTAIEHFSALGLRWLNLGAGAGFKNNGSDGLSRFKQGWSTGTRTAYFCGRIFDQTLYKDIVTAKGILAVDYFPAYRKGEFA